MHRQEEMKRAVDFRKGYWNLFASTCCARWQEPALDSKEPKAATRIL